MSSRQPFPNHNGVTVAYAISFGFLQREHVKVTANDAPIAFRWTGSSTIELIAPPPAGSDLVIFRETPREPLVQFSLGSTLSRKELDILSKQAVYLAEEAHDRLQNGVSFDDLTASLDAGGFRLTNMADPEEPDDAATRLWVEQVFQSLPSFVAQAEDHAEAAQVARAGAETAQSGAQAAQSGAQAARSGAEAAQAAAQEAVGTITSPFTNTQNGLVPAPGAGGNGRLLRPDASWGQLQTNQVEDRAITLQKIQDVAPGVILGRAPGGANGPVSALSPAQARDAAGLRRSIGDWWWEYWFAHGGSPALGGGPLVGFLSNGFGLPGIGHVNNGVFPGGMNLEPSAVTANSSFQITSGVSAMNLTNQPTRYRMRFSPWGPVPFTADGAENRRITFGLQSAPGNTASANGFWFLLTNPTPSSGAVSGPTYGYDVWAMARHPTGGTSKIFLGRTAGAVANFRNYVFDITHRFNGATREVIFRVYELAANPPSPYGDDSTHVTLFGQTTITGATLPNLSQNPQYTYNFTALRVDTGGIISMGILHSLGLGSLGGFNRQNGESEI